MVAAIRKHTNNQEDDMTNQEINRMTRKKTIDNIKSEIAEIKAGRADAMLAGVGVNPRDVLLKKYEEWLSLQNSTSIQTTGE
jgi:serine/threonine-protein kinase RIO1